MLPEPTVTAGEAAPAATGVQPKGVVGRVGNWAKNVGPLGLVQYGMMGMGVYQGAKDTWGQYDQMKAVEKDLASNIGQYNTLTKKHPWNNINNAPDNQYQKDTKELGVNDANMRALNKDMSNEFFKNPKKSPASSSNSGDLTMRGALQRDRSRYSRS